MVKDSFELRIGYSVRFVLSGLWVVEHSFPLFLLGGKNLFRG